MKKLTLFFAFLLCSPAVSARPNLKKILKNKWTWVTAFFCYGGYLAWKKQPKQLLKKAQTDLVEIINLNKSLHSSEKNENYKESKQLLIKKVTSLMELCAAIERKCDNCDIFDSLSVLYDLLHPRRSLFNINPLNEESHSDRKEKISLEVKKIYDKAKEIGLKKEESFGQVEFFDFILSVSALRSKFDKIMKNYKAFSGKIKCNYVKDDASSWLTNAKRVKLLGDSLLRKARTSFNSILQSKDINAMVNLSTTIQVLKRSVSFLTTSQEICRKIIG